jgi:predicted Zn-dependent peptidase
VNGVEAGFLDALETVDGFRGKADQLNSYLFFTGTPDYFEEDLARFRALAPRDLSDAALTFLTGARVALSIVPEGEPALALDGSETAVPLF